MSIPISIPGTPSHNRALTDSKVIQKTLHPTPSHPMDFVTLLGVESKDIVNVLKGQSPKQLRLLADQYHIQSGRPLEQDLAKRFGEADQVKVRAYLDDGRMDEAESLRHAVVDSQGKHARRILNHKTGKELTALRKSYKKHYGRDLNTDLMGEFDGVEGPRIRMLLQGEPDRAKGESKADFTKRQGDHVAKLTESVAKPFAEHGEAAKLFIDPDDLLNTLHGREPAVLREAERAYKARTGNTLRSTVKELTKGTRQEIALNYLDDGREGSMEKLRRAFDGNNDEDLIRRTLRQQTPEQRKLLLAKNGKEIRRLFSQLDDAEVPEMEALLQKGKLDRIDRLRIAVADGSDKGIVRALKGLSKKDRLTIGKDGTLLTSMYSELDDEEHAEVDRLLKGKAMSASGQLRHSETAQDFYSAAEAATTTEEKNAVRMSTFLNSDITMPRLEAHLRKGKLSDRERVLLSDDDEVLSELRKLSPEALSKLRDSKVIGRVRDELSGAERREALTLLNKGKLSTHQAVHLAVKQDDPERALEQIETLRTDESKRAFLSVYREKYNRDIHQDLDQVLDGTQMRKAENLLRTRPKSVNEVSDRVRNDNLQDRDDNSVGSLISNGLTDVFSDAGPNMDDQAREVEHEVRKTRRGEGGNFKRLLRTEAGFQDSRVSKARATKRMADFVVPALSAVLTGGLNSVGGLFVGIARASFTGRTLAGATAGIRTLTATTAGLANMGVEKAVRGNDFGTNKDHRVAFTSAAVNSFSTLTGAHWGHQLAGVGTKRAHLVKGIVENVGSELGNSLAHNRAPEPLRLLQRAVGGSLASKATYGLTLKGNPLWKKGLGGILDGGIVGASKVDLQL
jgi:hypothetical protein